ncbi:barstar family protein [Actinoplanes sp. NPDC049316]|uniref:barstar family protein n=1 Tax=Actinoplanes sp. NPDC049316 TaxID=3154727 RepID=UPI00342CE64E
MADDLVVDLRGRRMETLDDFWDAVSVPCGLPAWFGRNIEAWRDTIQVRGISDLIDRHDAVVVHVDRVGLFSRRNREARALRETFAGRGSRLVVHQPAPEAGRDPSGDETRQAPD